MFRSLKASSRASEVYWFVEWPRSQKLLSPRNIFLVLLTSEIVCPENGALLFYIRNKTDATNDPEASTVGVKCIHSASQGRYLVQHFVSALAITYD